MAVTVTALTNTTNSTAPASVSYGPPATGDLLIFVIVSPAQSGHTITLNGWGSGVFEGGTAGSQISLGDSQRDVSVSTYAGALYVAVYSALVTTAGAGTPTYSVSYAVATGTFRTYVYKATPNSGSAFPVRASRVAATGQTNGTSTGAGMRAITLSAVPDTSRDIVAVAGVASTATITNGILPDLDANNTDDTGAIHAQSGATATTAIALPALSGNWPVTASQVDFKTTPGNPWGLAEVIYYATTPATVEHGRTVTEDDHPVAGTSEEGVQVFGTAKVEHDTPHAGSVSGSGAASGTQAHEHDHPVAGTSEQGVQVFGTQAVEHDIAHETGYEVITGEVLLDSPTAGTHHRFTTLHATANSLIGGDTGDIRISLHSGAVVVNESGWTALTGTPTVLSLAITNPVPDETDLRFHWEVRRLLASALTPELANVSLAVEYWVVEDDTPHGGTVSPPPVLGHATIEHDLAYAGTIVDLVLIIGKQRDGWTVGRQRDGWKVGR